DGYSLCKSDRSPIWCCPKHQEIVLGRLTKVIRRLFGVGAGVRVEMRGTETLLENELVRSRDFVGCKPISPNMPGARMLEKCVRAVETSRKQVSHSVYVSNDTAYPIPLSAKTIDPIAVSGNPTNIHSQTPRSRRHEQSIPPPMKNVRLKPNEIF
ncbi:MAG: hypothetical protein MSH31_08325, partial [Clostridiales bacterium]|nr:hypothetical protein [Clostridiales bacterium]